MGEFICVYEELLSSTNNMKNVEKMQKIPNFRLRVIEGLEWIFTKKPQLRDAMQNANHDGWRFLLRKIGAEQIFFFHLSFFFWCARIITQRFCLSIKKKTSKTFLTCQTRKQFESNRELSKMENRSVTINAELLKVQFSSASLFRSACFGSSWLEFMAAVLEKEYCNQ